MRLPPLAFEAAKKVRHLDMYKRQRFTAVCRDLMWYAHKGTAIIVRNPETGGLAVCLARFVRGLHRPEEHDPDGHIVWIDLFYSDDHTAALECAIKGMQNWAPRQAIAFKRFGKSDLPRLYPPRFALRYAKSQVRNLENQHGR